MVLWKIWHQHAYTEKTQQFTLCSALRLWNAKKKNPNIALYFLVRGLSIFDLNLQTAIPTFKRPEAGHTGHQTECPVGVAADGHQSVAKVRNPRLELVENCKRVV